MRKIENIQPLTEEQKKLAEENHQLIYSFLNSKKLNSEEYYGIAAIGYVAAIRTYDPSKGRLATIAYTAMYNEVKKHWHYLSRKKYDPENNGYELLSLHEPISDKLDALKVEDTICDPAASDAIESVELVIIFTDFFNKLVERDKKILRLRSTGMSQHEIAEVCGVTQTVIQRRLADMIKDFKRQAGIKSK